MDFIRFLAAYNANKIDIGVIITNTKAGLERIKYKSSGVTGHIKTSQSGSNQNQPL